MGERAMAILLQALYCKQNSCQDASGKNARQRDMLRKLQRCCYQILVDPSLQYLCAIERKERLTKEATMHFKTHQRSHHALRLTKEATIDSKERLTKEATMRSSMGSMLMSGKLMFSPKKKGPCMYMLNSSALLAMTIELMLS
jgi:hypothetical protein